MAVKVPTVTPLTWIVNSPLLAMAPVVPISSQALLIHKYSLQKLGAVPSPWGTRYRVRGSPVAGRAETYSREICPATCAARDWIAAVLMAI